MRERERERERNTQKREREHERDIGEREKKGTYIHTTVTPKPFFARKYYFYIKKPHTGSKVCEGAQSG